MRIPRTMCGVMLLACVGTISVEPSSRIDEVCRPIFDRLVSTHPDTLVRDSLWHRIQRREVDIVFGRIAGVQGEGLAAVVILRGRPTVIFNPYDLVKRDRSDCFKQSEILHETIHVHQLLSRSEPESLFISPRSPMLTVLEARQILAIETAAYLGQCAFAVRHGCWKEDYTGLCQAYVRGGERAMRQHLFERLKQSPSFGIHADTIARWPEP